MVRCLPAAAAGNLALRTESYLILLRLFYYGFLIRAIHVFPYWPEASQSSLC